MSELTAGDEPALRASQCRALDSLRAARATGRRRSWVVLPPGAGKTRVGVEWARELGRPTVVLCPNSAIEAQWRRAWGDAPGLEVRTYQSVALFADAADRSASLVDQLHAHAAELVARLRSLGPVTLVLDECHHLVQLWGRLLDELLAELPDADVLGLTATPRTRLDADEAALVTRLFGEQVVEVGIPACVRGGELAPFAELAWLTEPTGAERAWLAEHETRFTELTTRLLDPSLSSHPLLEWLDRRWVDRADVAWATLARQRPDLTDAVLRLHRAGLLRLPPGARLGEAHGLPDADDWRLLVDDWVRGLLRGSTDPRDAAALAWLRQAAPAVGWQVTRGGVRQGVPLVDRVLSLSASKALAAVEAVRAELAALGSDARVLVLCDTEDEAPTRGVDGVLARDAGSATSVARALARELPGVSSLMVTGRTVAGDAEVLRALQASSPHALRLLDPGDADGLPRLEGGWRPREWVPLVTRELDAGRCQVLVGTRGLLGEGWDAQRLTCVVDLTTATTPAAVVQARGRALRLDPARPEKVAVTWSVACIAPGPGGDADWKRLVRKHDGFFSVDLDAAAAGAPEVVANVAHLDASFSPWTPPPPGSFDATNARMVLRAQDRAAIRAAWQVGTPCADVARSSLRMQTSRAARGRGLVLHDRALEAPGLRDPRPVLVGAALASVVAVSGVAGLVLAGWWVAALAVAAAVIAGGSASVVAWGREGRRLLRASGERPGVDLFAGALADALHDLGRSPVGSEAVQCNFVDGEYRASLTGVPEAVSREFVTALDELVAPVGDPRYLVPRWVADDATWVDGVRARLGYARPTGQVWHAVPEVFGGRRGDADVFARHLDRWVGAGRPVFTRSPEGEGALVVSRGQDPFAAATVVRTAWA